MAIDAVKLKESVGVDLADVLGQLRLPESVYERILRISLKTTDEGLIRFLDARRQNNFEGMSQAAHEIKGVYANLRVTLLSGLMEEIDGLSRQQDASGAVDPLLIRFQLKFEELKSLLEGR